MRSFLTLSISLMVFLSSFSQNNPFLKCKNETNERIRRNCITSAIQTFVDTNYNISAIVPYAKSGTNRIYTRFKVDQIGRIIDIQAKSSSPELELEAIRTLEALPYTIPWLQTDTGLEEEKTFENTYTLPIIFQINNSVIDLSSHKKNIDND
ncbi:hypothetical protein [Aquimarina sediminis]|uniref:hypothetical protein n=1 Tax=Aquimarina sediminis TaxID=2070536 RepID=UPI000FFEA088|nr:hypothetical protein [Aquimarina sediminis]